MTSTALLLLSLAFVWSIAGTTLEPTFDHEDTSVMQSILKKHEIIHDHYQIMKTRRTKDSFRHFNSLLYDKVLDNVRNRNDDEDSRQAKYDQLYTARESGNEQVYNLELHKMHEESIRKLKTSNDNKPISFTRESNVRQYHFKKLKPKVKAVRRRFKREDDEKCEKFVFTQEKKQLSHPVNISSRNGFYYASSDCTTTITGQEGQVIQLTFVDMFHIEDHPDCAYDYLEIRDGKDGYAHSLGKFCGKAFPSQIRSTGPNLWMKFVSDDTIEYEGFHINIEYLESPGSHSIPSECYMERKDMFGWVNTSQEDFKDCKSKTADLNQALDVRWKITPPDDNDKYKIYLNFTSYQLEKTNECEENVIQVFGSILEYPKKLAHYCGSMANPVTTRDDADGKTKGNTMYVRLYASKSALKAQFGATFTVFRTLNPNNDEKCNELTEFDCEDNTCIAEHLKCDGYANCRLKADEDPDGCKTATQSVLAEPHILTILVIFSLILSGMSFVFLFKCLRKLYQDQTLIKEHIRQSCEDRLDSLVSSRLTLDAKRLQRDSEPRASLERENHTNEMVKRQRNFSQNKPTSIDSDYVQETQLDIDVEPWRRDVDSVPVETEEVRIERNGRHRRSESKKEPSRKESKSIKEVCEEETRSRKEIRDVSVGAPDTKESGCQTRESLFQDVSSPEGKLLSVFLKERRKEKKDILEGTPKTKESGSQTRENLPEDDFSSEGTESGSGSQGRGFSTFGYSGATIVRPSPPAPATQTSHMTVELLRTMPSRQESQTKKIPDRRPMSTETTRSAPDVIIVSKPIR